MVDGPGVKLGVRERDEDNELSVRMMKREDWKGLVGRRGEEREKKRGRGREEERGAGCWLAFVGLWQERHPSLPRGVHEIIVCQTPSNPGPARV